MRTHQIYYILMTVFVLTGCGARANLNRRFNSIVYFNGINEYEAVALAETRLVYSPYKSLFGKVPARIRSDASAMKYEEYWFVDFTSEKLPDAPSYLVVIARDSGEIKLATDYFPRRTPELDGIVERINKKPAL